MALGLVFSFFTWVPATDAQPSPKSPSAALGSNVAVPAKDLAAPQSILTIYINDLNLPGWQPQPFYMWTQVAPPAIAPSSPAAATASAAAPTAAATTASAATVAAHSAAAPAVSAPLAATAVPASASSQAPSIVAGPQGGTTAEAAVRSVFSFSPQLPDGDSARQAILAEYRLTGFFRKTFTRGQRSIYIDVYDFQNSDGAYGAYNYLRRGSTTVLPRGDAASEDDASISFVQGKTFLSIYGTSRDDDESKEVLSKVASQAVQYIGDKGAQPSILYRLPQLDLVHGSEKIVMGPNSVRRFFPAPYLNSLALDNGRAVGCVGDYQMQEPAKERLKLMVLAFKAPGDAALSYQSFLTQVAAARNSDAATMINQPINVLKTGATYLAIEQRGADLLMIVGARKRFSPAIVLRQVR